MGFLTAGNSKGFRPGEAKYEIAHRGWLQPDEALSKKYNINTRKTHCWRCLRPIKHPIHNKKFRLDKGFKGWKGPAKRAELKKLEKNKRREARKQKRNEQIEQNKKEDNSDATNYINSNPSAIG